MKHDVRFLKYEVLTPEGSGGKTSLHGRAHDRNPGEDRQMATHVETAPLRPQVTGGVATAPLKGVMSYGLIKAIRSEAA